MNSRAEPPTLELGTLALLPAVDRQEAALMCVSFREAGARGAARVAMQAITT